MSDERQYAVTLLSGVIIGIFIGGVALEPIWCSYGRGIEQRAAVERGYAEYNQTTGVWQWKPATKESERE